MIRTFEGITPVIGASTFIDETAVVIGNVTIGEDSSVWPTTVIRGDVNRITIGDRTSIQDGSVLHVNHDDEHNPGGDPLSIGSNVTVGHKVMLYVGTPARQVRKLTEDELAYLDLAAEYYVQLKTKHRV